MRGNRFQLGAGAVLLAVCMVCVCVLCLLSAYTAMADRAAARQYADHISEVYECENLGQQWLAQVDAWHTGAGTLPENTVREGPNLQTRIRHENMTLDIAAQATAQGIQVITWSCKTEWQPPRNQTLWK